MSSPQNSIFMALCALLILAGAYLGIAGAFHSGPGWDDASEINIMNSENDHGGRRHRSPRLKFVEPSCDLEQFQKREGRCCKNPYGFVQ